MPTILYKVHSRPAYRTYAVIYRRIRTFPFPFLRIRNCNNIRLFSHTLPTILYKVRSQPAYRTYATIFRRIQTFPFPFPRTRKSNSKPLSPCTLRQFSNICFQRLFQCRHVYVPSVFLLRKHIFRPTRTCDYRRLHRVHYSRRRHNAVCEFHRRYQSTRNYAYAPNFHRFQYNKRST